MSAFHKQIFDMLMESQYWQPEQMLAFQRHQLSQLLKHAKANVPFYKERLDPVFRSNGDIDWDCWHEIPVVKRHHLVEQRNIMLATQLPPGHGAIKDVFSGGSSGEPIITTHNHLAGWVSEVAVHRAQCWHQLDWSQNFVALRGVEGQVGLWPNGEENGSWAPNWLEDDLRGKIFTLSRSTPDEQVIEYVLRKKAMYLSSRAKNLQSLALTAERLNIALKSDAVVLFGTGVTDDEREDFRRVFGARVISYYSSGEGYKMGISCETGHHYHVNSELTYLEVLDDDDNPCPIGLPGRVIITPFFNTAQPLIRYELGDIAIRGAACSCGKTLPVIQEISGRITHLFRFPDGSKIAPFLPDQEFNASFGLNTWQLVQTGPLAVELRYVQTDQKLEPNKTYAKEMIHKKIRDDLNVKFVRLTKTPLTNDGKFIQYKSELPKPA